MVAYIPDVLEQVKFVSGLSAILLKCNLFSQLAVIFITMSDEN